MFLAVKESSDGHIICEEPGSSKFRSMETPRKRPPNAAVKIRTIVLIAGGRAGASVPVSINREEQYSFHTETKQDNSCLQRLNTTRNHGYCPHAPNHRSLLLGFSSRYGVQNHQLHVQIFMLTIARIPDIYLLFLYTRVNRCKWREMRQLEHPGADHQHGCDGVRW